jgi:hypothetical protein
MDELASGFNIASDITLGKGFENMLGFTQAELDGLRDNICRDDDGGPPEQGKSKRFR